MGGVKIEAVFSKAGDMRFISHLDLMRLFQRALRRANLPVAISQGFSPHLKISIKKALKLGVESMDETLTVQTSISIDEALFRKKLNGNLPEGVRIINAKRIG